MVNSKGYRRGTRHLFKRDFRNHGTEPLSTFLRVYKVGDIVDIKVQSMFHRHSLHYMHVYFSSKSYSTCNLGKWRFPQGHALQVLSRQDRSHLQRDSSWCWCRCEQACQVYCTSKIDTLTSWNMSFSTTGLASFPSASIFAWSTSNPASAAKISWNESRRTSACGSRPKKRARNRYWRGR